MIQPTRVVLPHINLSLLMPPYRTRLIHAQKRARAGFDLADAKIGDTGLKLDDWTLERLPDGRYLAQIRSPEFDLELQLKPTQSTFLQGEQGFSRKGPNPAQSSYYYSEPQLQTSAKLTRKGKHSQWQGKAWLDHEWANAVVDPNASGWDWLGVNLADGSALMAFQMRSKDGSQLWSHASLRPANGTVQHFGPQQVRFVVQRQWQSPRTSTRYPVAQELHLQQGEKTMVWSIEPLQNDQEFDARNAIGILYWEGAVRVTARNQPEQKGQGYLELTGYDKPVKL
jgi:predicted secreted hydrolase